MTVTKKLPPLIFVLFMLFCHNVWAQTEKASIEVLPVKFHEIYSNKANMDQEEKFYQQQLDVLISQQDAKMRNYRKRHSLDDTLVWIKDNYHFADSKSLTTLARVMEAYEHYRGSKFKDKNQEQILKLVELQKRFKQKYFNFKAAKIMAQMMLTSSDKVKLVTHPNAKNVTYSLKCDINFYLTEVPIGYMGCNLSNNQTNSIIDVTMSRIYPDYGKMTQEQMINNTAELHDNFMQQPVDELVTQIWRRALNKLPKTHEMIAAIDKDLDKFSVKAESFQYLGKGFADGVETGSIFLDLMNDQFHLPPLREFELTAEYGDFTAGNNEYYPIKEKQKKVKLIPRDTIKIYTHTKDDGSAYGKFGHKQLKFTYQTFDCTETGDKTLFKKATHAADYSSHRVLFTVKLKSKLSKDKDRMLLKKYLYFQCPVSNITDNTNITDSPYFTANITRTKTKKVLDDPGYGYVGGNALNSPFMVDRITTEKSKQVIYFDFANKKLFSVPLMPFHNVTKDNEYYEFNRDTCSVEYDRKVATKKLSPHNKLLYYDGHLSTPFKPQTPMRFRFGNKDLQFSVQQLKRGSFSYHDTESRQLLPEMEYFIPSHRISGELGKLNQVMDITKAFAVTFEQMNGEDPCDISALKREMDAFQDGINNGFFAPQEKEFTEYSVNIRRSNKGEIKLFNKQRKKMHARRFTKALEKVAIDEQKWKKYLPKELELLEKEKLNFEETWQLFAFPVLMLENFDQVLAGLSKEFDLEKLNQLKHLNEQQKRQLLEQLKQMTKVEQRDFLQQLSQSSTDNQAKMIEELVK